MRRAEIEAWVSLRAQLWREDTREALLAHAYRFLDWERCAVVLVAEEGDALIGMIEVSLRTYAEGCESSPVPFIEGWFVAPEHRRRGVGGALVAAVETWAAAHGYTEIASDTTLDNTLSQRSHTALGFEEVERIVAFRKTLRR
ncbi:MAG TPA: aminoglycoside 6'-N-acetyltransferase [Caulobacterales bacterium]|nr:aminoglycoside 6'-N-acetyltransferase [Caulobacterales bacterium]